MACAIAFLQIASNSRDTDGKTWRGLGGVTVRAASTSCRGPEPERGGRPERISYCVAPSRYTSVASSASAARPSATSGAMYCGEPMIEPSKVAVVPLTEDSRT